LPMTRHCCNLDCVGLGAKPRRWAPLTRDTQKGILSEYNEDLIFYYILYLKKLFLLKNTVSGVVVMLQF